MEINPKQLFDRRTLEDLAAAVDEGVKGAPQAVKGVEAAHAGDLPAAAMELGVALQHTDDLRLLFLGFQFFFRTGDHARAEELTRRRLTIAEREGDTAHVARACTNLGLIHLTTGRHASALPLMRRAVEIDERLGNLEGLARDLGNLANVYEETGDLQEATRLNLRSLHLAEQIGAHEIAAGRRANLGDIALTQGRTQEARDLWARAASEFARLGIEKWQLACEAKLRSHPRTTTDPTHPAQA